MSTTIQVSIDVADEAIKDMMIAELADLGFDGFEETETGLLSYIALAGFDGELTSGLEELVNRYGLTYTSNAIDKQNWNALWESNFEPVLVDDFVGVRANFHDSFNGAVEHDIIITPKMSFGTGHHGTTYSVMQLMRGIDFANKSVFDFGTGTGLLAILAHKLGAVDILAVDNDDWCIENASENIVVNNTQSIGIHKVDNAKLNKKFNIIIANINKNIILDNLAFLAEATVPGGVVLLSGLLVEDEPEIEAACAALGWKHQETRTRNNWIALHYSV
ncbi:MAG: 50S ribosomal protein L11 methyltransferase [Bacteroidetes bacterium]|nr:50S ribosomal protein L11 methyltransferase [Bacteroidota bacterium]